MIKAVLVGRVDAYLPLNIFAASIVGPADASIASPPIPQLNLVSPKSIITLAISHDMTFPCSSVKSVQTTLRFWPSMNSCAIKAGPALELPSSKHRPLALIFVAHSSSRNVNKQLHVESGVVGVKTPLLK